MSPRKIIAGDHWLRPLRGRGPVEVVASGLPLPLSPLRECRLDGSPVGVIEGGAGGMSPRKILAGGHWLRPLRGRGPVEVVASGLPLPLSPLRECRLDGSPMGVIEGGAGGMSPRKIIAGGHWLRTLRGRGPAEFVASGLPLPLSPLRECRLDGSPVGVGRGAALRGRVGDEQGINDDKRMMGSAGQPPDPLSLRAVASGSLINPIECSLNRIEYRSNIDYQIFISA